DPAYVQVLFQRIRSINAVLNCAGFSVGCVTGHPLWHDEDITAEHRALTTWDPDSVDALAHLPGLPTAAPAVPSLVLLADPSERIPPAPAATLRSRGWHTRTVDGAGHTVHRDDPTGFLYGLSGWL
ncbi:hypothetical protein AB0D07_36970, partial [Streptomyces globisporus]